MIPTDETNPTITWEQLMESVNSGAQHPEDTQWTVFRYLKQNYKTIRARTGADTFRYRSGWNAHRRRICCIILRKTVSNVTPSSACTP